ncbi:MAG: fluoride efflux transporter CrcB [Chloroflexi bacterium]|nr:fluoride efflux transporter CrcB [Chloroflexota bacterium]
MSTLIAIAAGGAVGATLRFIVSGAAYNRFGTDFPYGTLLVNVIGCFLIGFLSRYFEDVVVTPNGRALILTGGLGAFTTFSTYGLETVNLWRDGEMRLALLDIFTNNILGIIFVLLGFFLAQILLLRS